MGDSAPMILKLSKCVPEQVGWDRFGPGTAYPALMPWDTCPGDQCVPGQVGWEQIRAWDDIPSPNALGHVSWGSVCPRTGGLEQIRTDSQDTCPRILFFSIHRLVCSLV